MTIALAQSLAKDYNVAFFDAIQPQTSSSMTLTSKTSTSNTSSNATSSGSFRLKGGLYPLTLMEVNRYQRAEFEQDLQAKVAEAPTFFKNTPVVLCFENFEGSLDGLPLAELKQLCQYHGLLPVAVRSSHEAMQARGIDVGLAPMQAGRGKALPTAEIAVPAEPPPQRSETSPAPGQNRDQNTTQNVSHSPSKLINSPVRSGQQVYAPGGDLIVNTSVSPGAEVLADGNIHIYGALRGRALAGVQGDRDARIFCQSLEAELICVAGEFKLDEDFREGFWKKAVQIYLDGQTLHIVAL